MGMKVQHVRLAQGERHELLSADANSLVERIVDVLDNDQIALYTRIESVFGKSAQIRVQYTRPAGGTKGDGDGAGPAGTSISSSTPAMPSGGGKVETTFTDTDLSTIRAMIEVSKPRAWIDVGSSSAPELALPRRTLADIEKLVGGENGDTFAVTAVSEQNGYTTKTTILRDLGLTAGRTARPIGAVVPKTGTTGVVTVLVSGAILIPKELRGNVARPDHVTFVRRIGEERIECYLEDETVAVVDGAKSATSNLRKSGVWITTKATILRTLGMSDGRESTQLTVRLADADDDDDDEHDLVVCPNGQIGIPKRLRDRLGSNRVAFIRRAGGNVTELYSVQPPSKATGGDPGVVDADAAPQEEPTPMEED